MWQYIRILHDGGGGGICVGGGGGGICVGRGGGVGICVGKVGGPGSCASKIGDACVDGSTDPQEGELVSCAADPSWFAIGASAFCDKLEVCLFVSELVASVGILVIEESSASTTIGDGGCGRLGNDGKDRIPSDLRGAGGMDGNGHASSCRGGLDTTSTCACEVWSHGP